MDFSTIKQIVIPEGIVKKIEDGDGNIIWQKQSATTVTISYACLRLNQYLPASKTVQLINNQYALTSADLPTINLSSAEDQIVGWTIDGSTQLQAGNTISTNVTLLAIHKRTVSKSYDWSAKYGPVYFSSNVTSSSSDPIKHTTSLWRLDTAAKANYTTTYTKTWTVTKGTYYYKGTGIRGFNGIILDNLQVYNGTKFKIHWNPAVIKVTFAAAGGETIDGNHANTYPMIIVRDGNTTTKLYTNANVSANFVSGTITAGASANAYLSFQYGGWNTSGSGFTA